MLEPVDRADLRGRRSSCARGRPAGPSLHPASCARGGRHDPHAGDHRGVRAHADRPRATSTRKACRNSARGATRIEWKIARLALNLHAAEDVNRFRKREGTAAGSTTCCDDGWPSHRLNLMASSPALLDRPGRLAGVAYQLCGFLELPSHEHEARVAGRRSVSRGGPAPVFMGFGSLMPMGGSAHLDETIAVFEDAARLSRTAARSSRRKSIGRSTERPDLREAHAAHAGVSRAARPWCITPVRARRTRRFAPACRRSRCRTCRISSRGRRSCSGSAWRRGRCGARSGAHRRWPIASRETIGQSANESARPSRFSERMQGDNGPATAADLIERSMRWYGLLISA